MKKRTVKTTCPHCKREGLHHVYAEIGDILVLTGGPNPGPVGAFMKIVVRCKYSNCKNIIWEAAGGVGIYQD